LNVDITFTNIPSNFVMDQKALSVLLSVVKNKYKCDDVSISVTTTNEYTCSPSGNLIPLNPVEVLINPVSQPGEPMRSKDFSVEAVVIGLRLYELLIASHPETLNLPSKVKVVSWSRESYSFLGRESLKKQEWR